MNSIFKSIRVKIISQGEFKWKKLFGQDYCSHNFYSNYYFCTYNCEELQTSL